MTRYRLLLPVLLLSAAAWGCTRPVPPAADAAKPLEARVAKLEAEVKSLAAAKTDLQTKLTAAEGKLKQAEDRAKAAELARDEATARLTATTAELVARTNERDAAQGQFEAFRKNIRDLLGRADLTAKPAGPTVAVPASRTPTPPAGTNGL